MSSIEIQHLEMDRESQGVLTFTVLDPATGLPQDLTGYEFDFVAKRMDTGESAFVKSFAYSGPTNTGLVEMTLLPADVAEVTVGRLGYDLFATVDGERIGKVLHGFLTLTSTSPF